MRDLGGKNSVQDVDFFVVAIWYVRRLISTLAIELLGILYDREH